MEARNRYFNQAKENEQKGELKVALANYKKSLQKDNRFFDGWLNAGVVFSKLEKPDKAVHCFKKAIDCKEDERAYYNLAAELYKQDKFDTAISALETSIQLNPRFIRSYLLAGYSFLRLSEAKKGLKCFNQALKIEPENISIHIAIVMVLHDHFDLASATKFLDNAISIAPNHPALTKMKGIINLEEGKVVESIEQYKKLAASDAELENLSTLFSTQLDTDTKTKIVNKKTNLETKPVKTSKDFFDLSLMSILQGEGELAMDYLLRVVEKPELN
ncbi:MAG: tetratricopeptide repeat protein [Leptospirales bacterium]